MTHPNVEEIMDFVMMDSLDEKSMKNAAVVTAHISGCKECLKITRAFRDAYDEIVKAGTDIRFGREFVKDKIIKQKQDPELSFKDLRTK